MPRNKIEFVLNLGWAKMNLYFNNQQFLYILLVIFSFPSAMADEKCTKTITSEEMAECAIQNNEGIDLKLNSYYHQIEKALDSMDSEFAKEYPSQPHLLLKSKLIAAQRAWLVYRNQSCKLEANIVLSGNPSRGDSAEITTVDCETKFAQERIKELTEFCSDYDLILQP